MKSTPKLLLVFSVLLVLSAPVFAGGNEPAMPKTSVSSQEKSGTNLRGQSGDFEDYLDEGDDEAVESNSVELADLGEGAKLAVGGDDPAVGVKVGY